MFPYLLRRLMLRIMERSYGPIPCGWAGSCLNHKKQKTGSLLVQICSVWNYEVCAWRLEREEVGSLMWGRSLAQLMGSQHFPRVEEELGREREGERA